jgi:hypothetical protein
MRNEKKRYEVQRNGTETKKNIVFCFLTYVTSLLALLCSTKKAFEWELFDWLIYGFGKKTRFSQLIKFLIDKI